MKKIPIANKILYAIASFALTLCHVCANSSTATVAGGAIVYEKSKDISMDKEVLTISLEEIKVKYDFTNNSSKDVTTTVAFPLPPSPVTPYDTSRVYPNWDDTIVAYTYLFKSTGARGAVDEYGDEWGDVRPLSRCSEISFTNFETIVEGRSIPFRVNVAAVDLDGNDITKILLDNDIPISAVYLSGFMAPGGLDYQNNFKRKLLDLNLLGDIEWGEKKRYLPRWQTRTTYYWNQTFPAQKTISVTHSYRPHPGIHGFYGKPNASFEELVFDHRDVNEKGESEDKKLGNYTISLEDKNKILLMFKKSRTKKNKNDGVVHYFVKEIRYILMTGANWKGPIKSFRLEVIPPTKTSIVLTSLEGKLKKTKKGHYIFETKNFTPKTDLKILFLDTKNW